MKNIREGQKLLEKFLRHANGNSAIVMLALRECRENDTLTEMDVIETIEKFKAL